MKSWYFLVGSVLALAAGLSGAGCTGDGDQSYRPPSVVFEREASATAILADLPPWEPTQDTPAGTNSASSSTSTTETVSLPEATKNAPKDPPRKTVAASGKTLYLRQALALALLRHPALSAMSWEVRAREARQLQAARLPNPELSVEVEDLGGTGKMRRFQGSQTTIQLSQLVELGGRRMRRMRLAALDRDIAAWDAESLRLNVLAQTSQAFINVLIAQGRLALREEMTAVAERSASSVEKRVAAGKVPQLELIKANVFLATQKIALERTRSRLKTARDLLVSMWQGDVPHFQKVAGDLRFLTAPPTLNELLVGVEKNPDLARWATEIASRKEAAQQARASRIPDLTISGGVRYAKEDNDQRYVVGISIPFPIFNRNKDEFRARQHELAKASDERKAARLRLRRALTSSYFTLRTAYAEGISLREKVLPKVEIAYAGAKTGYEQGKFNYLDVLDAQRTLLDTKEQYLSALATYHTETVAIERLVGAPLSLFQKHEVEKVAKKK